MQFKGKSVLAYFWPRKHFDLLIQMTQREIQQRYKGSWLGMGWSMITPLIMLVVYTFVFQSVFQARWPGMIQESNSGVQFALNLFVGIIFFTLFSDVMTRSPSIISQQPNLVKKVVFPLELLPWVIVLSALFQAMISFAILLIGTWLLLGSLPLSLLCLPLLLLIFLPLLFGMAWGLSGLGVYLPDTQHLTAMITTPLMFLSPVFYPISMLPEWAQPWLILNPLTVMIEAGRAIFFGSQWPALSLMLAYTLVALLILLIGALSFRKLRRGFADVL